MPEQFPDAHTFAEYLQLSAIRHAAPEWFGLKPHCDPNAIMLAVLSQLICDQIEGANAERVCIEGLILRNVRSSSDQCIRHADSCTPFEARFSITTVRVTPPQLSSKVRLTMFPQGSLEGG